MFKNLKKTVAAALVGGVLTTSTVAPVQQAQAGLIFLPAGVGVVLLILGVIYDDLLLIILDADGNLNQDALEKVIAQKYPMIEDRDVVRALASAVREKAASVQADGEGRKQVSLSREEVLSLLAPTGMAELNPEAAEQIVRDLQ
jgi:hypothetical protein